MLSCELTLQFDCDSVVMMHFVDDTTRLNLRLLGYQIDSRLRFLRTLHSSISFESSDSKNFSIYHATFS
jgi:hypothetical protein